MPVPTERVCENHKSGGKVETLTCLATFTEGEPCSSLCGGFVDKIANHLDVVTGHNHLLSGFRSTLWPMKGDSDISCAQEKLRAIVFHERSVSATLLFREDLGSSSVSDKLIADIFKNHSHKFGPGTS